MPDGRRLRGIAGDRAVRALGKAGWYVSTQRGSHIHLRHEEYPGVVVTVPVHRGKPLTLKTLYRILGQARLSPEEFEALL